jgi:hypothetical protein
MAAIKASVNVFALLDGEDPGDKRLADFEPQHKDQPKKKPVAAAACDYKLKFMKQPSPSPPAAVSRVPRKNPTPAVAAGPRYTAAASPMAGSANKQTTTPAPPPPGRNTNLIPASALFAYPSARERIFKQRKEEFERRQAELRQEEYERQQAKVIGGDNGKSVAAGDPPAGKGKGKTHGVRVQQGGGGNYYVDGAKKKQADATVKEPPKPPLSEKSAAAPVVRTPPPPPPSIDDICLFPSLK